MTSREILRCRASFAAKLGRFTDLYRIMKNLSETGSALNKQERHYLYLAYAHKIAPLRSAWYKLIVITALIDGSRRKMDITKEAKLRVEKQIVEYCSELINNIDAILLPRSEDDDAKVFFHKMRADMTRYLIDLSKGLRKRRLIRETKDYYEEAKRICAAKFSPFSPLSLSVEVNYIVFVGHVMQRPELAKNMAKKIIASIQKEIGNMKESQRNHRSMELFQLLKDDYAYYETEVGEELGIDEVVLKGPILREAAALIDYDFTELDKERIRQGIGDSRMREQRKKFTSLLEEYLSGEQVKHVTDKLIIKDSVVEYDYDYISSPSEESVTLSSEDDKAFEEKRSEAEALKTSKSATFLDQIFDQTSIRLEPPDGVVPFSFTKEETDEILSKIEADNAVLKALAAKIRANKRAAERDDDDDDYDDEYDDDEDEDVEGTLGMEHETPHHDSSSDSGDDKKGDQTEKHEKSDKDKEEGEESSSSEEDTDEWLHTHLSAENLVREHLEKIFPIEVDSEPAEEQFNMQILADIETGDKNLEDLNLDQLEMRLVEIKKAEEIDLSPSPPASECYSEEGEGKEEEEEEGAMNMLALDLEEVGSMDMSALYLEEEGEFGPSSEGSVSSSSSSSDSSASSDFSVGEEKKEFVDEFQDVVKKCQCIEEFRFSKKQVDTINRSIAFIKQKKQEMEFGIIPKSDFVEVLDKNVTQDPVLKLMFKDCREIEYPPELLEEKSELSSTPPTTGSSSEDEA